MQYAINAKLYADKIRRQTGAFKKNKETVNSNNKHLALEPSLKSLKKV